MLTNYIKIAWKVLLRHPFYTFITLFGISLTLTVLMVLTSFLDHLLGANYPEYRRDRSLYLMQITLKDSLDKFSTNGDLGYKFIQQHVLPLKTPEKIGLVSAWQNANAYSGGKRIKLETKFADANFWAVTDFAFVEGKPFSEQNVTQADPVAVISDSFRDAYFGGGSGPVVGKTVEVDNARYRVIGVVKAVPITRLFTSAEVYLPYTLPKSNYQRGNYRGDFNAIVLARSRSDFKAIQAEYNESVRRIKLPIQEDGFKAYIIKTEARPFLEIFLDVIPTGPNSTVFYGVVGLIMLLFMLIPTLNLVNLNIGRSLERASEIGVRKAFGAPTQTLLGQFVIENIFITLIGGLIALGLSAGVTRLINQSGWVANMDLRINLTVLAVSLLLCLFFGVLSGLLPAWRMAKLPIADALKG